MDKLSCYDGIDVETESELDYTTNYDDLIEADFDIEEDYLYKLKTQRRRIEELSRLHLSNEAKLLQEIEKNILLKEENYRLVALKKEQFKFETMSCDFEVTAQENVFLREQNYCLKEELAQVIAEKSQIIQKLKQELGQQRDKVSNKMETLEEALSSKEEEYEEKCRYFERNYKEHLKSITNLKYAMAKMKEQHNEILASYQRKFYRYEREYQTKASKLLEFQSGIDQSGKYNVQLKEYIFKLSNTLSNRDMYFKNYSDKMKIKISSLKKELKTKGKENVDTKDNSKQFEKEKTEYRYTIESLRAELSKSKYSTEQLRRQIETDFSIERYRLYATLNQQLASIQDLVNIKNQLMQYNNKLQQQLKRLYAKYRQRKQLLKTEIKEIDRLEKVIDRIVE